MPHLVIFLAKKYELVPAFIDLKSKWNHQENVWDLFKLNDKDVILVSLVDMN